jgi:hypothetical protein
MMGSLSLRRHGFFGAPFLFTVLRRTFHHYVYGALKARPSIRVHFYFIVPG